MNNGHFNFPDLSGPNLKPDLHKSLHSSGAEPRSIPLTGSDTRKDVSLYIDINLRSSQLVLATHEGNMHRQLPQLTYGLGNYLFSPSAIHKHAVFKHSQNSEGLCKTRGSSLDPAGVVTGVLPPTQTAAWGKTQKLKMSWVINNLKNASPNKDDPSSLNSCYLTSSLMIYGLCITKSNKSFISHFTVSILTTLSVGLCDSTCHDRQIFPYVCSDARLSEARMGSPCTARRGAHHTADTSHEQPMVLLHQSLSLFS